MSSINNVVIHDNWLTEGLRTQLLETVNWMPLYFLNRARSGRYETHELDIHWYYPIAVTEESLFGRVEDQLDALEEPLDVIQQTWQLLKEKLGSHLGLYECSLSANTFGTEGNPHYDFRQRSRARAHVTILIYCNPEWNLNWAGETLVYDEHGEVSAGIVPKPGRVAVLLADPYHVGRSVARICPYDRRVLVFKAWDETRLAEILAEEKSAKTE